MANFVKIVALSYFVAFYGLECVTNYTNFYFEG